MLLTVATVNTTALADGSFAVLLPPLPSGPRGSPAAYTIRATAAGSGSEQDAVEIVVVLFGEVWLCGGQSKLQFSVGNSSNATKNIAAAAAFPHIRLFTASRHYNKSSEAAPQQDLDVPPEQPRTVAALNRLRPQMRRGFATRRIRRIGRRVCGTRSSRRCCA